MTLGRRRGRPKRPRIGAMASTSGISCVTSCRLAALVITANGTPPASVTTWCLLARLRRSVGFGPVSSPPPGALMVALSTKARDKSSLPAALSDGQLAFVLPDSVLGATDLVLQ